jgi:hypothetical protein
MATYKYLWRPDLALTHLLNIILTGAGVTLINRPTLRGRGSCTLQYIEPDLFELFVESQPVLFRSDRDIIVTKSAQIDSTASVKGEKGGPEINRHEGWPIL